MGPAPATASAFIIRPTGLAGSCTGRWHCVRVHLCIVTAVVSAFRSSSMGETQKYTWAEYFRDVYGDSIGETPVNVAELNLFYWSAPFSPGTVRIWSNFWLTGLPELETTIKDNVKVGDGFVHMYDSLGFWRVTRAESPGIVLLSGTVWAEVMRQSIMDPSRPGESDATGVWYYVAHGSGFWLNLGRYLDTTCTQGVNISRRYSPVYSRDGGGFDLICKKGVFERCQPAVCLNEPTCAAARAHKATGAGLDCKHNAVRQVSPPMLMTPRVPHNEHKRDDAFDSITRWPPLISPGWRRHNFKEIIDTRRYGTPDCKINDGPWCNSIFENPCGGRKGRSSSQHIRIGWLASGKPCSSCQQNQKYLNCGSVQEPSAAHNRSLNAPDGFTPVSGRCFNAHGQSNLSAPTVHAFKAEAYKRKCIATYFYWPPKLPPPPPLPSLPPLLPPQPPPPLLPPSLPPTLLLPLVELQLLQLPIVLIAPLALLTVCACGVIWLICRRVRAWYSPRHLGRSEDCGGAPHSVPGHFSANEPKQSWCVRSISVSSMWKRLLRGKGNAALVRNTNDIVLEKELQTEAHDKIELTDKTKEQLRGADS